MSTARRIAKNAGITYLGDIILKILTFVLIIFIARYLGDVEYGKFTFALSFTSLFFILMDLGTRILIVREITENKSEASKIISNVLILKFFSSIFVYLLILSIAYSLGYSNETILAIAIAAFGIMFDSFSTTIASVFQAYERLEYPVLTKVIRILVRFAFTLPLLMQGKGFIVVLLVYALVQLLNFIVSAVIVYTKFVKIAFDFDKKLMISILKRSFPFLLSGVFASVYYSIDITMMSKLAPTQLNGFYSGVAKEAVIGWYSAAYNLLDAVVPIAGAVAAAILPVAIAYHRKSRKYLAKIYTLSVRSLMYIAFPLAVGTTILAEKIMMFIYGEEYIKGALALQIMIWTIIPLFVNYILGAIMIAIRKEKEGMIILFVNVVVNIVLNIILIPKFSLYGAAFATVLTELFYFAGYYYIISRYIPGVKLFGHMLKPIAASAAMGFVIFKLDLNIFLLILVGALVYLALMYLLKAISKEDMLLVKKVLKIKG